LITKLSNTSVLPSI